MRNHMVVCCNFFCVGFFPQSIQTYKYCHIQILNSVLSEIHSNTVRYEIPIFINFLGIKVLTMLNTSQKKTFQKFYEVYKN